MESKVWELWGGQPRPVDPGSASAADTVVVPFPRQPLDDRLPG